MQIAAKINSSRFILSVFSCCYLPREPVERPLLEELDDEFERVLLLLLLLDELFEREPFTDGELWLLLLLFTVGRAPCPCGLGCGLGC